jgi:hypothetical protein
MSDMYMDAMGTCKTCNRTMRAGTVHDCKKTPIYNMEDRHYGGIQGITPEPERSAFAGLPENEQPSNLPRTATGFTVGLDRNELLVVALLSKLKQEKEANRALSEQLAYMHLKADAPRMIWSAREYLMSPNNPRVTMADFQAASAAYSILSEAYREAGHTFDAREVAQKYQTPRKQIEYLHPITEPTEKIRQWGIMSEWKPEAMQAVIKPVHLPSELSLYPGPATVSEALPAVSVVLDEPLPLIEAYNVPTPMETALIESTMPFEDNGWGI